MPRKLTIPPGYRVGEESGGVWVSTRLAGGAGAEHRDTTRYRAVVWCLKDMLAQKPGGMGSRANRAGFDPGAHFGKRVGGVDDGAE